MSDKKVRNLRPWITWLVVAIGLGGCNGNVSVQTLPGLLTVTPASGLEFGPIHVGESSSAEIYLFNSGEGELTLTSVRPQGSGTSSFEVTNTYSGVLRPGQEVPITVSYQPVLEGEHHAELAVSVQGNDVGVVTVPLHGVAVLLDVGLDPSAVDFGRVETGAEVSRSLTVQNRGGATAILSGVSLSNPNFTWAFTRAGASLPLAMAGGSQAEIEVSYLAPDPSPRSADLTVVVGGATLVGELKVNLCEGSTEASWDQDGDGVSGCEGDCDDLDPGVNPGMSEEFNGVDDNCNGEVDEGTLDPDQDGDGYGEEDCDDTDPDIHPGQSDGGGGSEPDGIDNDCDGFTDEDTPPDLDLDGDGYTTLEGDCDEANPEINPGMSEVCNGVDDNCDEALPADESDHDGDTWRECAGDCDDNNEDIHPGMTEGCSGVDDNCDDVVLIGEVDNDGDGWRVCSGDCDDTNGNIHPQASEMCNGKDDNCDGQPLTNEVDADADNFLVCQGDCDDLNAAVYPGAVEKCNGIDDNCDGSLGSGDQDTDGDGLTQCQGDCDDTNGDIYPGASEKCNGLDDNCDGRADPAGDADSDGIPNTTEGTVDGDGDGIPACLDPDSDNDGLSDKDETQAGTSTSDDDSDGDGYSDLVEVLLETSPTSSSSSPADSADLVYLAPEGGSIEPRLTTLPFDTYIQYLDLYFSFDNTSSMRTELGVMHDPTIGLPAIIVELTCDVTTRPCQENIDCSAAEVCGLEGLCIQSPLTSGCIPNIWTGVGIWSDLDTFNSRVWLQHDPNVTAEAIPYGLSGGGAEAVSQAAQSVADPASCTLDDPYCKSDGIGCPGYREDSLRVLVQITDADEQCGTGGECVFYTPGSAGRALLDKQIRFVGLVGESDDNGDPNQSPEELAQQIGIASGTVDKNGIPYVYPAIDLAVADKTVEAVRDLVTTFPLKVSISITDEPGDDGDARKFIDYLVTNTSGQGGCTSAVGGQALKTVDTNGDSYPDTFEALAPGTPVCWDLHPVASNTIVVASAQAQVFHAVLEVLGGGAVLDRRDIYFVVPPQPMAAPY